MDDGLLPAGAPHRRTVIAVFGAVRRMISDFGHTADTQVCLTIYA